MGMIWRAMPLLSTLAALVIIAHSAEEGYEERRMERDYRYELRPRLLDVGTPNHDQPWRAIEAEPMMQESVSEDHQHYEEPIKRRRPRKRKRRPLPSSDEISQERNIYQEETRYQEPVISQDSTEMPRRRRKRPGQDRPSRWTEEFYEFDRPLRRRNRKKRPVHDSGPIVGDSDTTIPDEGSYRNPITFDDVINDDKAYKAHFTVDDSKNIEKERDKVMTTPEGYSEQSFETPEEYTNYSERSYLPQNEEKSHSEISMEDILENSDRNEKPEENSSLVSNISRTMESGAIDPVALKEILKKSNGTSLSEILQERNLSLADLLRGREDAISALKSKPLEQIVVNTNENVSNDDENKQTEIKIKPKLTVESVSKSDKSIKRHVESKNIENDAVIPGDNTKTHDFEEHLETKENSPRIPAMRRFPGNSYIRRKLRLRPANSTMKGQLSKDLIAQTARRYLYYNSRNNSKGEVHLKQVLPFINQSQSIQEVDKDENTEVPIEIETTTVVQVENTTILKTEVDDEDDDDDNNNIPEITTEISIEVDTSNEQESDEVHTENEETTSTTTVGTTTEITTTEKPKIRYERPALDEKKIGLRRQVFNNRLKRKRMKQKNTTAEFSEDDQIKDLLGLGNVVASSEIISRTQKPDIPLPRYTEEDFTSLDDFLTTPVSRRPENVKNTRISTMAHVTPRRTSPDMRSTTEETAKIEIEEILNDTRTSARLSKILMERNMTLNELVEHRERGSSHVHLADIFHNASKEPNPPEPFLSKSSIEPISRETYPLRALLEANLHDPAAKASTIDPNVPQYIHIPVVMDFGNNVNENGENMGIMSLLSKITEKANVESSDVKKDSEGTPYISTIINVNASVANTSENVREGKELKETEVNGWNKLFELMRRHHENSSGQDLTTPTADDIVPEATNLHIKDVDGDGLIVLDDLQHLNAFENNIGPKLAEKLDTNTFEGDSNIKPGILDRLPSSTRSVTVATASIVGLAMVLFLLTYSAFKWRQKRNLLRKKQSFSEERIPTPVFESRKGKSNCSTRSISPMLASNIYTMNTLDSRAGTESPEYMWDTLRKPFQ